MLDVLPVVFWAVAAVWALAVCVICVVRGRLFTPGRPHVDLVSWYVIAAQFVSVILAMVPFVVYKVNDEAISPGMREFYTGVAWPAGIALIVLVALELVLMYVQARRATRTEMDEALNAHAE